MIKSMIMYKVNGSLEQLFTGQDGSLNPKLSRFEHKKPASFESGSVGFLGKKLDINESTWAFTVRVSNKILPKKVITELANELYVAENGEECNSKADLEPYIELATEELLPKAFVKNDDVKLIVTSNDLGNLLIADLTSMSRADTIIEFLIEVIHAAGIDTRLVSLILEKDNENLLSLLTEAVEPRNNFAVNPHEANLLQLMSAADSGETQLVLVSEDGKDEKANFNGEVVTHTEQMQSLILHEDLQVAKLQLTTKDYTFKINRQGMVSAIKFSADITNNDEESEAATMFLVMSTIMPLINVLSEFLITESENYL